MAFSRDRLPEPAIRYYQEYLKLAQQIRSIRDELKASLNIATEYTNAKLPQESITWWKTVCTLAQNIGDKRTESTVSIDL